MGSVSVVIPAHNRPVWLGRAIASVLEQTHTDFELIVVDDGSNQDLSSAVTQVKAAGHRWETRPHQGVAAARDWGISVSAGEWLALLDSDDYWLPDKLSTQWSFHQQAPHFQISQTAETWIRDGKRVKQGRHFRPPSGNLYEACLDRCCVSCSSVMMRRELYDAVGGFDSRYTVCEDYALWLRVAQRYEIALVDQPLTVKHAGHADQLSRMPLKDVFRAHALLELWRDSQDRTEDLARIKHVLTEKLTILLTGARKQASEYTYLFEMALAQLPTLQNQEADQLATAFEELMARLTMSGE